jgi:collagen type IV alpha-3-binding protein
MLQLHEFDELRFDVRAHDCTYFLRAATVEEKEAWVESIEANKVLYTDNCTSLIRQFLDHILQL